MTVSLEPSSCCFPVVERTGSPETLVGGDIEPGGDRLAVLVRPTRRALVLGSSQSSSDVDERACAELGIVVARRRSGGGAVLVGPGEQVWLDVFVPVGDPFYDHDVGRAAWWLGELWRACLTDLGLADSVLHRGPVAAGRFGRRACFAGSGQGEVSHAGRKLVGISQRRDRRGAWLHSMALLGTHAGELATLLSLPVEQRRELEELLDATTLGLQIPADRLERALAARLT